MVETAHILVTGAKGMLGADLVAALRAAGKKVVAVDIEELDITDKEAVANIDAPSLIINCAAYTAVDKAESEKKECFSVNVDAVRNLTDYCKKHGTTLMQLSTDYVFDGQRKGYDEDDRMSPISHYGQTKAEAEDIVRELDHHFVVRTSWLFGKHGPNFVETVRRVCNEKGAMQVVNDQHGAPTYTKHLATAILQLLNKQYGTYHLTSSGNCTWYEFALAIKEAYGLECSIVPCTTEQYPTPAARPEWSILNNNKGPKLPAWQEGLNAYVEETR